MWYLHKAVVVTLEEVSCYVVDLVDLSYVTTSCESALTLCDDADASEWRQDMIPFVLLGEGVLMAQHHCCHGLLCACIP